MSGNGATSSSTSTPPRDDFTGDTAWTTIASDRATLSPDELQRLVGEAQRYRDEDEEMRRKVEARNELEKLAYSVRRAAGRPEVARALMQEEEQQLGEVLTACFAWLQINDTPDAEESGEWEKELKKVWDPIITRLHGKKLPVVVDSSPASLPRAV